MTSATIKLFLPHGDAKRLRVGEGSNWIGKALAAPRTELDDLLSRPDLDSAGVNFLLGTNPDTGKLQAYILLDQSSILHEFVPQGDDKWVLALGGWPQRQHGRGALENDESCLRTPAVSKRVLALADQIRLYRR